MTISRQRRVLIIVQNLPVPFDRRVWLESVTLTKAGYQVSVVCPKMKGYIRGHEVLEGIDIFRYALPWDATSRVGFVLEFLWCFLASSILSLWVAIAGRGFDVLHVCNPPETYWLLGLFWRLLGKTFVFDHHDLSPELYAVKFGRASGSLYHALVWLEYLTFRCAHLVIATNESHKKVAVERGHKASNDVHVVRSGPDPSRFARYPRSSEWHNGRKFLICYLGEICPQDGVEHLVRAMNVLHNVDARSDIQCLFIGSGPHLSTIQRYADDLGLADCCGFTGRVSDEALCRILSSADLGIDPGPWNPWSDKSTMNKVVEYMYFGLPVVAYDLRETRVSAGRAGLYAESGNERALADGIAQLLDAPDLRRRMGQIARSRIQTKLSWEHSAPALLAAYDHAFAIHGRSASRITGAVQDAAR